MKKSIKWIIPVIILLATLIVGGFYFQKHYRIVIKSNLENLVKTSGETGNKLTEANKTITEKDKQLESLRDRYYAELLERPETEYVTEYVPVYDDSILQDEMSKLRKCLGTDFPGVWCN